MKSGQSFIDEEGRVALVGELFEQHNDGITVPFVCVVDTGCTFDLVVPLELANAVFAQPEGSLNANSAAGASSIEGTIRKVNARFGGCIMNDVNAFVPNTSASRSLIGIGLLQKMNIFLGIDFKTVLTKTGGNILTNDRRIPFMIGKLLHCSTLHGKYLVSTDPCPDCGQTGDPGG